MGRTTADDRVTTESGGARLTHVDAMRGIAAIWVVLFHEVNEGPLWEAIPSPVPRVVFDQGALGVAIFFALSGYVIARSLGTKDMDRSDSTRFLARRYVRLLPPYYFSMAVVLGVAALSSLIENEPYLLEGHPFSIGSLFAHLTLTTEVLGIHQFSDVYWSLCDEAIFYLVLTLMMWGITRLASRTGDRSRAMHLIVAPVAIAAIGLGLLRVPRAAEVIILFYAFLAGSMIAWASQKVIPASWAYAYFVGLAIITIRKGDAFAPTIAVTCALLWWHQRVPRVEAALAKPPFQFLGKISYSIYLIHIPVLTVWRTALDFVMDDGIPARTIRLVLGLPLVVLSAWIMWWIIERPAIEWSRRLAKPRTTTPTEAAPRIL